MLNRTAFSGVTFAGWSSLLPGRSRLHLDRMRAFKAPNLRVRLADWHDTLNHQGDNCFAYLDPPYMTGRDLYGKGGDYHKRFDHARLRDVLLQRDNWVMSYNDCETLRDWYSGYRFEALQWDRPMTRQGGGPSSDGNGGEVLIINAKIGCG